MRTGLEKEMRYRPQVRVPLSEYGIISDMCKPDFQYVQAQNV